MKRKGMSIVNQINCVFALILIVVLLCLLKDREYRIYIENRSPYSLDEIYLNINGGTRISLAPGETSRPLIFDPPKVALSEYQFVVYVRTLGDSLATRIEPYEFVFGAKSLDEQTSNRIAIGASPFPDDKALIHALVENGPEDP
jgi:hypothetical protein